MPDWKQLRHAYGSAEDLPYLLRQMFPDPSAPVWNELWSCLCHQDTVYSASFAALPVLLEMARRWFAARPGYDPGLGRRGKRNHNRRALGNRPLPRMDMTCCSMC